MNLPEARTSDIIEQEADSELLIYDLRFNKAYTLNETSKIVYLACGTQTVDDLKRQHKLTDDLIHFALDELAANNLIENYQSSNFAGLSRREVIRRVGLTTMIALPVIAVITAPAAATAASLTQCQRNNCMDANQACNPQGGCGTLGALICCAALNTCFCSTVNTCTSNGGQICPAIV